jgi:putative transposase
MSKKRTPLVLSEADQAFLEAYVNTGNHSARSIKRARALLSAAADEPIEETMKRSGLSEASVYNIKQRFRAEGLKAALEEKPRPGQPPKVTPEVEAQLTALACSTAPEGHARWSLRLLKDKIIELAYIEDISYETVRQVLKKANLNLG